MNGLRSKGLDTKSIESLIRSELSKEIEKNAAALPEAEGHEYFEEVRIERIEDLGNGLHKVFFSYIRGYVSSHMVLTPERGPKEYTSRGYITVNESLKMVERV